MKSRRDFLKIGATLAAVTVPVAALDGVNFPSTLTAEELQREIDRQIAEWMALVERAGLAVGASDSRTCASAYIATRAIMQLKERGPQS